jgi:subtilisin-like proprotein convertase family protein
MLPLLLAASLLDMRVVRVQDSLSGMHYQCRQFVDGVPLLGSEVECGGHAAALSSGAPATKGGAMAALQVNGQIHFVTKTTVHERPMEPYAEYRDIKTGELLRREALFWTAKGRVFEVNPVAKLNDPSLQDRNNAADAVPAAAYSDVDMLGLPSSGPLVGENCAISDLESPAPPHADASQSLLFDRSQPQFEEVNAYFHIDRIQRYLQSLGYVGSRQLVAYAVPVDPHAANGTDNSYYVSSATPGRGALYFGDGGTDDAEDPDIMIHEFMHAIQDWIAPGAFGGDSRDQSRALGEGYADYWAFSDSYSKTKASGRDPACIADWDARCWLDDSGQGCTYPAGSDCLRRVDSAKTMADYLFSNTSGTEHKNGEIWSSALREIFLSAVARNGEDAGKRLLDTLVIESYFGTPPSPTFSVMAQRMIDADRVLYAGADATTICSAMTLRGILTAADCDRSPRGEVTYFQSPEQGIAIPNGDRTGIVSRLTVSDPRTIAKLYVHVHAQHPARGNLRITLIAPGGTTVLLQDSSLEHTADLDVTYGLDAQSAESLDVLRGRSAAGVWQLQVADVFPLDAGTLLSWDLGIEFVGDAPAASRPVTAAERRHIAVVGHVSGANGTRFVSDVRILNRGTTTAGITLIYTPSGANGNTTFAAVKASIAAGQVMALDDIVANQFQTSGTGQLEIQGDVAQLAITSRTYTKTTGATSGTYGQFVPAMATGAATGGAVIAGYAENDAAFRTNYGFAETSGNSGTVRITVLDARNGAIVFTRDHEIAPYSHGQFTLGDPQGDFVIVLSVSAGAHILGYTSVIDNRSGDPIYVPAVPPPPDRRFAVAPAIHADGANGTHWRTDVRTTNAQTSLGFEGDLRDTAATIVGDVLGTMFGVQNGSGVIYGFIPGGAVATTRTWTDSPNGSYGQFVPFRDESDARSSVDILHVESSADFRTNLGVFATRTGGSARLTVYDAAGVARGSFDVTVEPLRLVQMPLLIPIVNGRVHVEVTSGTLFAYGSLVDNRTGDPTFLAAQ